MKILSLNLHCLQETNIKKKNLVIANKIIEEDIDVCLFQEVAQHKESKIVYDNIKDTNQLLLICKMLNELSDIEYSFYYDISNYSFNNYEEGLGILSKHKLLNKKSTYISNTKDYNRWSSRLIVSASIRVNNSIYDFYSSHLGWTDKWEKFESQFDNLMDFTNNGALAIMGGDFNISEGSNEYKYIIEKGYLDLFLKKGIKENATYHGEGKDESNKRIDYFFSKTDYKVLRSEVLFTKELVSDHYGILIELEND